MCAGTGSYPPDRPHCITAPRPRLESGALFPGRGCKKSPASCLAGEEAGAQVRKVTFCGRLDSSATKPTRGEAIGSNEKTQGARGAILGWPLGDPGWTSGGQGAEPPMDLVLRLALVCAQRHHQKSSLYSGTQSQKQGPISGNALKSKRQKRY